ncbi:MAG TPA: SPOR domain-containing protein [Thermoanaerobaculia bacterium]|nr:SPOR domain-containing protein [Thermoanaerobaculia bacterium]
MTNPHEPSYYEIALTNRQVVVAFVILLLCLVSAFFSGLWIGRESAARAQEQIVRNTPPTPAEPQEGQDLEEFRFFEDDQEKGTTPAPAPPQQAAAQATPSPTPTPEDTTLLDDLGGGGDEEAVADPDLPEGRRRHGRRGRNAAQGDEEETAAAAPAVPTPSPTPARPASPRPAVSEPRVASGQLVIQVFSTADMDQAESVRGRLVKGGHKAYLSPVQVGGRTMYRVRIGPFDSRDQAQKVAEQVRKGYKLDTWVTE